MKYTYPILGIIAGILFSVGLTVYAVSASPTSFGGTGTTTPSGILYGDNGGSQSLNTVKIGSGCTFSGGTLSCPGAAGTVIGTISTSTADTVSQILYYTTTNGYPAKVSGVATTSIGADGTSLSFSGTAGAQIGGAGGTYSINTGNTNTWSVLQNFNYSSSTLYSTFKVASSTNLFAGFFTLATSTAGCLNVSGGGIVYSKSCSTGTVTSITLGDSLFGTSPLTTTGTIYGAVGTSTTPTLGQLAFWSGVGDGTHGAKLNSVATSTATCSAGISCSTFTVVGTVNPSFTNSGVTSIVAGTGISQTNTTGAVTVTNQFATSSVPTLGNLAYWTGIGTPSKFGSVATSSETCSAPLSCASFDVLTGGGAISLTTPLTVAQGGTNKGVISPASLLSTDAAGTSVVATSTITINNLYATSSALSTFVGGISLASTTPWLNSIFTATGTTTVSGQMGSLIASTTSGTSLTGFLVNWQSGNTVRVDLTANATIIMNATSSNPVDGFKYILKLCQDGTGGRTVTFVTPQALSWYNGTTTISATARTATLIGMIYDSYEKAYNVVASTTVACKP